MLIDARTLPDKGTIDAEVCIIGAGAAGITLAREFSGRPFRVCILESGGLQPHSDTQMLSAGANIGLPYFALETARLRLFGGSTNHWGGLCRPFDPIDFAACDWIPHSGWPLTRIAIEPYYQRARQICRLESSDWDPAAWEGRGLPAPFAFASDRVVTRLVQVVPSPRSFGQYYRDEVKEAGNVFTYINANVLEIETDESARNVTRVRVACLSGNRFSVMSRIFVLAAGGIENPRLLLLSDTAQKMGLGNQHDLVGRFFMDHPRFLAGIFRPSDRDLRSTFYQMHRIGPSEIYGYLSLSKELQRAERLSDVQLRLIPVYQDLYKSASSSEGAVSLRLLLSALRRREVPDDLGRHLINVLADLDDLVVLAHKRIRTVDFASPIDFMRCLARINPVPNPDSRVTLGPERDALGQRRARLDWRLSELDKRSAWRTMEIVGVEVGRAGLGRMQMTIGENFPWPADTEGGYHHMGTTRMHVEPRKGVVDENCQVHGMSNLFIAGSSVFPTAGSGTPTLLIVALAVRLAELIKNRLR